MEVTIKHLDRVKLFIQSRSHTILWIVPLSVGTAMAKKSNAQIQWPWFILFFCLAAVANTYVHTFQAFYPNLKHLGVIGLTVTLFLIGTGLSKKTLQEVGVRPLLQGILVDRRCSWINGADSHRMDSSLTEV